MSFAVRFGRFAWLDCLAVTTANTSENTTSRTYEVRTFGCQMNVHDSERLSGLLEDAGYVAADEGTEPDLVVFNTCAVRENADQRLYGSLGQLKNTKANHPGMQIAVGGCLAQKDRDTVIENCLLYTSPSPRDRG